ncbi:DUF4239 domain-containing protein [Methyloferula stellata]|uniref:bestrophin-like domain n=1 Tax=Methyloferula stellata TaxID=876270 RepID=UPI00035D9497|nr:DUF4239 domain-containing protein [Methyloferula stellata]
MLSFWLNQPIWLMFLILAAAFLITGGLIFAWSFAPWTRSAALSFSGVVAPYFTALSVLLALMTGFVASDTWERQRQADRIVQSESDNVLAVYDLSIAAVSDMSAIRKALKVYVDAVITDEWPHMAKVQLSTKTDEALGLLLQEVAKPEIATVAGNPVQAALLNLVLRIRSDRGARIAINEHSVDDTKWLGLLILGLLTQLAIGVVHLDRPRAQLVALLLFSAGLVSTLGLIAIHEWPFDGPSAIKPFALETASRIMTSGLAP